MQANTTTCDNLRLTLDCTRNKLQRFKALSFDSLVHLPEVTGLGFSHACALGEAPAVADVIRTSTFVVAPGYRDHSRTLCQYPVRVAPLPVFGSITEITKGNA